MNCLLIAGENLTYLRYNGGSTVRYCSRNLYAGQISFDCGKIANVCHSTLTVCSEAC